MTRRAKWPLVAAWAGVGALVGCALSDPFATGILLLVPMGLVAAWLLWNFDRGRETGAALIGASVLPILLAVRSQSPACPVGGELAACEPGSAWPWVVAALLLILAGSAIIAMPAVNPKSAQSRGRAEWVR